MSRSATVGLVVGAALGGLLGVLVSRSWGLLQPTHHWFPAVLIGLLVYFAATSAVLARRIADPELETPILAWIGIGIVVLVVIAGYIFGDAPASPTHTSSNGSWFSSSSNNPNNKATKGMGLAWAITGTIVALAAYGGLLYWFTYEVKEARLELASPAKPSPSPTPAPTSPLTSPGPTDLASAIAAAKPAMTDDHAVPSPGARQLAQYLSAHARFTELASAPSETSLALVEKDPAREVGKRLCATGTLARIERATVDGTDLFSARLVTKDGDAIELYAVGGTGNLVKRSTARFCGVVTGRLDANGSPATFAVGMFDVPAEHP